MSELREIFQSFFEREGHKRLPSASLVPASIDPSVLLTTAGMQPLKPYFLGREKPPHSRLTSCQKCFRTTDIDEVGNTARHLTFFEMLGNFSIGDYFKREAVELAWRLSTEDFGLQAKDIWITVFAGDEKLGLGPDEESVRYWLDVGVPGERIVRLPRSENFWQAGPKGPCGPCSELYLDRGEEFGSSSDRPGDDTERFLEYWNLVFMQYNMGTGESLEPLPDCSIDTGLGLERMAAILQGVPSVYETDLFKPLVELGEGLSGRRYGEDEKTTRALRILADHGRAMTFLVADGVVPSNEDRGYILRRIMRRAIYQARLIEIDPPLLTMIADRVIDMMGDAYPELRAEKDVIKRWASSEEESFSRTLEQGTEILAGLVERAREEGSSWIGAADAFKLHDTYGFPYDLTREMLAIEGLAVDDEGFHELMAEQRERARMGTARAHGAGGDHERVLAFASSAGFEARFVGYETTESRTSLEALEQFDGKLLAKLPESPFYAEGGGQAADSGHIEAESGTARVADVYRIGDDQVIELVAEKGELKKGQVVRAVVERETRHATACNHTATHLLHAALRNLLGDHVRQAGSYVGPDKLRFDFAHTGALTPEQVTAVEDAVNEWILAGHAVRAIKTTRRRAEEMGAVALFGEKYGDRVRMIEVEGVSRELCGGTHVANTAEIGCFKLIAETSSAANVRRIEALTGEEAVELLRGRDRQVARVSALLRVRPDDLVKQVKGLIDKNRDLERRLREHGAGGREQVVAKLVEGAADVDGVKVVIGVVEVDDPEELLGLSDQVKAREKGSAVVLGAVCKGRPHLVANFSDDAVARGFSAVEVIREAATQIDGGGGGRERMARAGGRQPAKLEQALESARSRIGGAATGK